MRRRQAQTGKSSAGPSCLKDGLAAVLREIGNRRIRREAWDLVSSDQGGRGWRLEIWKHRRDAKGELERKIDCWWLAGPDEAASAIPTQCARVYTGGRCDLLAFTVILSLLFPCPLPGWFPTHPHSQSPTSWLWFAASVHPPRPARPSRRPAGG